MAAVHVLAEFPGKSKDHSQPWLQRQTVSAQSQLCNPGGLISLSMFQLPHLQHGDKSIYLTGLF